ncbi:MAG: glycosyltransferase family 4 protein [Candidatus Latescibacterota bacterium]|nr:glycosyltransferase family 4 protein [Candidatus Latescibacterota bacterium]
MRVLFVTQYGTIAASSRTRVFQYLPYLRTHGIDVEIVTVLPDSAIAGSQVLVTRNPLRKISYYLQALWRTLSSGIHTWRRAPLFDVLFVQKVIFPAPVRWLLRRASTPMIYDFDDAIFTTEVRDGSLLAAWKHRRNARGLPAMLTMARRAVVENKYTGDFARRFCPIVTITGPIDVSPYGAETSRGAERGPSELVLGWIGSATTSSYLDLISEPLARLQRRHPDLSVQIVGAQWQAPALRVDCAPWSLESEVAAIRGFDVGLMPVPDDPWTRGKGGYKLLQYMAAGLPVVTSPVGINCDIVRDGETGYLAESDDDWEQRLESLITDSEKRRSMGDKGRRRVKEVYSLEAQQPILLSTLRELSREKKRQ